MSTRRASSPTFADESPSLRRRRRSSRNREALGASEAPGLGGVTGPRTRDRRSRVGHQQARDRPARESARFRVSIPGRERAPGREPPARGSLSRDLGGEGDGGGCWRVRLEIVRRTVARARCRSHLSCAHGLSRCVARSGVIDSRSSPAWSRPAGRWPARPRQAAFPTAARAGFCRAGAAARPEGVGRVT